LVRIDAIIRPSRLTEVQSALEDIGIRGLSIIEIKGAGMQKGYTQTYRGAEYRVNLLPKIQLIVVVKDGDEDRVAETIELAARIGEIGDGKIFISPITEAVRIRTGERGDDAIS
jgi:nitrogen regulatory protein P-II 1